MNSYMDSIAMSFNFNDIVKEAGADLTEPENVSPAAAHDASSHRSSQSHGTTVYQTTGPEALASPMLSPGSDQPAVNPRSCVTCRRRKVRCDKQMPCSNCRRAQIPCVFPAPGRAPRQSRPKDPNAPPKQSSQRELELMKRLRKLEGIVEELSGQIEVESGGKNPSSAGSPDAAFGSQITGEGSATIAQRQISAAGLGGPSSGSPRDSESVSDQSEAARKKDLQQQFGRLVLNDHNGSKRYVSSGFWSKINDELDSIREETQKLTDEDSDSDYDATPADSPLAFQKGDHHSFILGYRSSDVNLRKCQPLPSHVPFLWSVYQENVEPLIKLLHVPSMDPIIRNARKNHDGLTPGQQALVFAIYYAAVTSLEPEEVQSNLGANKDSLLTQYRFAVEQSLTQANFLTTSDFSVLQAFTIFLVIVRRHDESRFCWSLVGLLVHLAQGMGLHRDGSHFGLSPLETEMRRRLWWGLLVLDLRSAEELGTDLTISDLSFDTQIPSNFDDSDLTPTTTEFPEPKDGRSDMAVALVRYEICGLSRRLYRAGSAAVTMCPRAGATSLAEREQALIDVYQRVESKFLKHVLDEQDPLYWMAAMVARVIMAKMCLIIYQPMLFPGSEHELSTDIRYRIFVAAIEMIEYGHVLNTDHRCKQYRWLFMTYTNWHSIAFVLIEACRRPWTALTERGWEAVNGFSRDPVEYAKSTNHTAVFLPLRKLFMRARKHRTAELARLKADPEEAGRLDYAERMNPAQARFGPVPGMENRMDQVRARWWLLIRPDGSGPLPPISQDNPLPPPLQASSGPLNPQPLLSQPQQQQQQSGQQSQPQSQQQQSLQQPVRVQSPNSKEIASQFNLTDAAMSFMDGLLIQNNPPFPMTALFPLTVDAVANQSKNPVATSTASGIPGMGVLDFQAQIPQPMQGGMRQQPLPLQMQPLKEDHIPPYAWPDPFTSATTKFDDLGGEDTDMLGEEFSWQDWSQSLRGMEMETNQTPHAW